MDTAAHWQAVTQGRINIIRFEDSAVSALPFMASRLDAGQWQALKVFTADSGNLSPFEQLACYSAKKAINDLGADIDLTHTAFVLSTTKGNIELLGSVPDDQLLLHYSARQIARYLGIPGTPFVVSLACASGIVALQHGMRLLTSGRYKNVVVTGCDRFSRFVLSGFQSFQAVSDEPCRPFDARRKGISLGEAAATIVLSSAKPLKSLGQLLSGATSNDANHISGPSRTGQELAMTINRALSSAGITAADIGMISAHGTGTIFNDDMEARAFHLAGLAACPVHSFKGYTGHTLGAAGVLESVMLLEGMRHQELIPSAGFEHPGVPEQINVTRNLQSAPIAYGLKTASGFGGCNATIIWKKAD